MARAVFGYSTPYSKIWCPCVPPIGTAGEIDCLLSGTEGRSLFQEDISSMSYQYIGYLKTNEDVEFWHDAQSVTQWRLSFHGQGRYFTTAQSVAAYCAGRFWIRCDQIDALAGQLETNASSILIFEPKPRYKYNYRR